MTKTGALDALMSVDTVDVRSKATLMFEEIGRLLSDPSDTEQGGTYMCVTLAEGFIVSHLMSHFGSTAHNSNSDSSGWRWHITVGTVTTQAGPSPFTPFLVEVSKRMAEKAVPAQPIRLRFDQFGHALAKGSERTTDSTECLGQLVHVQV
jgi:hypothetical protein